MKCKNNGFTSLLSFSVDSILGIEYVRLNIGPTQSVLEVFALNAVQTCLGAPGRGLFRKKGTLKISSYGEGLTIIDLFEGL